MYKTAVIVDVMQWTPDDTIRNALWLGGGQWAGKSTVSGILAERHDLVAYHYDFYDVRIHEDRWTAAAARRGEPITEIDGEEMWIRPTPAVLAERVRAGFPERFAWTLDELRGLTTPRPVLAEGWGLRPELVEEVTDDLRRMVVMVPTDDWRRHQATSSRS